MQSPRKLFEVTRIVIFKKVSKDFDSIWIRSLSKNLWISLNWCNKGRCSQGLSGSLKKSRFLMWFIYIYKTDCNYVPMSLFHARTARPISTKFCTDLPTNPGMVLSTSMTPPTLPLDPGVPQTPKDVSSSNFSGAAPGPGWLVIYIYKSECLYLPMSPFHARTARPISIKFCMDLPTNSGKVLNTSMTLPIQPLDPGNPIL